MKHSSVPAYSIGLKYAAEPLTTDKLAPSPDTYNVRLEDLTVPSTKFMKGPRSLSSSKADIPGPGTYYIPTFVDQVILAQKNRPSLSIKEKRERVKIESPGPGSFHPQVHQKSLSYSMGSKTYNLASNIESISASPAAYSPNYRSIEPVKPISFTRSQRESELIQSQNPGPGHYNPSLPSESPRYSFPSQERSKLSESSNPSPFNYLIQSFTEEGRSKGITIVPKRETKRNDEWVPGPGSYNAKLASIFPTFSIGKGKRPHLTAQNSSPGPGEYSISPTTSPGKSIGKGKRPSIIYDSIAPGPGSYESKTFTQDGPKVSLQSRRDRSNKDLDIPGPAHYSPEYKSAKGKSFSAVMGSAKRKFEEDTKGVPGPGSYENNGINKGNAWSFGKSGKVDDRSGFVPGPGAYEFLSTVPDMPKYLKNDKNKN